jgi:hypothetical protein
LLVVAGRFAPGNNVLRIHPLAVRREAPHNQRIQHTSPVTNKFAPGLAADPQHNINLDF